MSRLIVNPLSPTMKEEKIQTVLYALAGQNNCDGEPYDQMQAAADYINDLENEINNLRESLTINGIEYLRTQEDIDVETK